MISTFKSVTMAGILATACSTTFASDTHNKTGNPTNIPYSSGSTGISSDLLRSYYGSGTIELVISTTSKKSSEVEKYPEHIESIKDTFKLSNDELAKAFKVSRKTLYNWKNQGSESHSVKTRKRIFDLYVLSKDWIDLDIPNQKSDLEKPILENKSIKDLFFEDSIDSKKILFAGNRLKSNNIEDELF